MIWLFLLPILVESSGDLPAHIRPSHYNLYLDSNLDTYTYTGNVVISIAVQQPTTVIKLHASEQVAISHIELFDGENKLVEKLTVGSRLNAARDLLQFTLTNEISPGNYTLRSNFSGEVSAKILGYYQTGYDRYERDERGEVVSDYVKMAATHLSPDKARTVFPAFDEPAFRATITLTLTHPDSLQALSDMPVAETRSIGGGRNSSTFQPTPAMATYLLAWVFHDFSFQEVKTPEGVRIRHYVKSDVASVFQEKLAITSKAVQFFNSYFGIPYPLPKLDTIGIPNYLVGGMENWGLITMTEDSAEVSDKGQWGSQRVSYTNLIAHEVSHMWFGNLVTMTWWDDLWLKEGMATYLSWPGTKFIMPEIDHQDHLLGIWLTAMSVDKIVTSHPVHMPIEKTSQITQIFDSITYQKGATVLMMLREVMGELNFKQAMKNFLTKFAYSTAGFSDLLSSMTDVLPDANKQGSVRSFMNSFILQKNYPIVTVEKVDSKTVRLIQSRYVRDCGFVPQDDSSPFNFTWHIPITYITDAGSLKDNYVIMGEKVLELTLPQPYKWLKLNSDAKQMFVTSYGSQEAQESVLKIAIASARAADQSTAVLNHRDRGHVLYDIFNNAQIGKLDYSYALNATYRYLRHEKHYIPYKMVLQHFADIRGLIDESLATCLRKFITKIIGGAKWKDSKTRSRAEDRTLFDELKNETLVMFARTMRGPRPEVEVEEEEFTESIEMYKEGTVSEDGTVVRDDSILAMKTNDPEQVEKIGNTLLDFPAADVDSITTFIALYSVACPGAVWKVYKTHWDYYNEKFGLAQFTYAAILQLMVGSQHEEGLLNEIQDFFKTHTAGAGTLGLANGLENAYYRIKFKRERQPGMEEYLRANHCECDLYSTVSRFLL